MNVSDIWDWAFMWQMFRNFMATYQPFVMMIVAVALAGILLTYIVNLFIKRRSS